MTLNLLTTSQSNGQDLMIKHMSLRTEDTAQHWHCKYEKSIPKSKLDQVKKICSGQYVVPQCYMTMIYLSRGFRTFAIYKNSWTSLCKSAISLPLQKILSKLHYNHQPAHTFPIMFCHLLIQFWAYSTYFGIAASGVVLQQSIYPSRQMLFTFRSSKGLQWVKRTYTSLHLSWCTTVMLDI